MTQPAAIRCPRCGAHFSHTVDGKVKVRVRLIAFGPDGRAEVHCSACGQDVPLPLTLDEDHRPRVTAPPPRRPGVRFTLQRHLTPAAKAP